MEFFPKAVTLFRISLVLAIVFISFTAQFVPPSDHSPCSNIPGSGNCELNDMNFAGRLTRSPPLFPAGMNVKKFAAAVATSMENKSNN
ncbi:hypothetical protein CRYUN_Cryun10bG0036400 [Craigia yunnanensis]